ALELLEEVNAPVGLRTALLLRMKQDSKAAGLLKKADAAHGSRAAAELSLLQSNAETEKSGPSIQLEHLNRFLAAHNVSPVTLRESVFPLAPTNVESSVKRKTVSGPLVSVLMTAFNTGNRIASAIDSVLEQTYHNIELIVID